MSADPQQPDRTTEVRAAADLADQALAQVGRLKVGTWDSVQALALVSIAKSLAVLAASEVEG